MGEEHLRALFDTAQSSNPGTTKLAEGLRWECGIGIRMHCGDFGDMEGN